MAKKRKHVKTPLSHDAQLIRISRGVAKLEADARILRKKLRIISLDLRHERKVLRNYVNGIVSRSMPPLREFGEIGGIPVVIERKTVNE
jgi:hypothetical protein